MELATPESERIVREVCERVTADDQAGRPVPDAARTIHDIDQLLMEANSGASFEQYFRWASAGQISSIVDRLHLVGATRAAELTRKAVAVAFPSGIPETPEALEAATEWSSRQEEQLEALFARFEQHNGAIINALARHALRAGA